MKLMEQSAADPSHRRLSVDSQQLLSEGANFVPPRKPTNQFHIDLPSRPAFPKGAVTRIDDPSVETEPELITNIEPRVPLGRKAGTARAAPPFRAGSNKDMDVTGNWGPFLGMGGPDSASLTPLVAGERPANSTGRSKLGAGESATPALGDLNSPSPVAADYYGTGLGSTPALPGGATPGLLGAPDRGNLGQPDERSPGQGSTGDQQLLPPEQDPNFQRTGSVASNVSGAADPMQSGGAAGGSNLNPDWSNGFWLGRGDGADGSGDPNVAMQGVNFNQNMQYQEPGNMAGYGDPYGGQQGGMDLSNPNSMRSGGGGYGNPNSYNNGQYAQQGYGMQMGGNMGYQGGYGNMMGNYGSYQGQGMFSGQQGGYGDFHGQGGYGSQGYNMSGMPMYQQGGQPGNMQSQLDDWQRMGANGNNQQMMQGPGYMSQLDPSLQMQQAEFGAVQLRQGNQPVHLGTLAPDSTVMGVSMQPNQQRIPGMQGGLQTQNPLSPSETAPKKSSGKRQAAVAEEEDEEDEEENGESSESEPEQRSRRRKTKGDSDDDFGSRRKKPKAGSAPMRRTTRQAAQPSAATTPSSVERVRREKAEMVSEAPRQVKVQPAVPRGQQQQFQEQEQMVLHQQAQHVMSAQHLPIQAQQQAALSNQSQIQHMHHFQQQPQHQQIVQMPAHQQMHIQHQGGNRQLAAYAPPGVAMPPAHTTTNENAANVDESLRGLSTNKQQLQTLLQQAHVDPNTGDHFCPVCNKPFKKMVLLKSHLKMHDPTKSFQVSSHEQSKTASDVR